MAAGLASLVNDNLRQHRVRLANCLPDGRTRSFGTITAASSGIPVAVFNRVFVFEPPEVDDFRSAVEWMAGQGGPFEVTVPHHLFEAVREPAADLGLAPGEEAQPGLVLTTLVNIPPPIPDARFTQVSDEEELDMFVQAVVAAWSVPLDEGKKFYSALLGDEHFSLFFGLVGNRPAACGMLLTTGETAGVYTVGVAKDYRRRGIGKAMTWEVLRTARKRGCLRGVLQSTRISHALYESMGFETVVTYHNFTPAGQAYPPTR